MSDHLSQTFAALSDPTRRAILIQLSNGETSVSELAKPFRMTSPAITKHLKVLEKAGLISRSRQGQRRPAKLEAQPLKEASAWIDQYRAIWEARFDHLDEYLSKLQAKDGK